MERTPYCYRLGKAIDNWLNQEPSHSVSGLARELGITRGSLYAKRLGRRGWKVGELEKLARLGVAVPPFVEGGEA